MDLFEREKVLLAPYAMHSAASRGRTYPESPHPYRAPFQRDRDRIVHSAAYRRLSAKTQVFTGEAGDYHRTRLTHTIEVASVARTLARALRLNEDLVEALALAHDLGHPPFGHAGESALDRCLAADGGFCHNRHALRIVTEIEQRYPDFPGLNLSLEVLEGQAARANKQAAAERPLLEAQVVDAADSVTYDTHDADDALELGLISIQELLDLPLWRQAEVRVRRRHHSLDDAQLRRAILHELIDCQVGGLLACAQARLTDFDIDSVDAARRAPPIVAPSDELAEQKLELERFLAERVYRHPRLLTMRTAAQQMLAEMFAGYLARTALLPDAYRARAAHVGWPRTVADYIAGMTDRYAQQEHARLFA
ncbi:MAG: deoxyguanosinetriphosphate triphosphohydrolase [Planctomycetia bacterium]|nr:deoxyguanosinetriphosphate triphosphohydrolase [Planctomycetia bacterium]